MIEQQANVRTAVTTCGIVFSKPSARLDITTVFRRPRRRALATRHSPLFSPPFPTAVTIISVSWKNYRPEHVRAMTCNKYVRTGQVYIVPGTYVGQYDV